jgi:hypothetical protein
MRKIMLLTLTLVFTLPGAASAAGVTPHLDARPLGGPAISIWAKPGAYRPQLRATIAQVNRAHVGITLALTASRAAADVTLVVDPSLRCLSAAAGEGEAGTSMSLAPGCLAATRQIILAHELGHVLGLEHERSACSVMNPVFYQGSRGSRPIHCRFGQLRTPYAAADLAALRVLYTNQAPVAHLVIEDTNVQAGTSPWIDASADDDGMLSAVQIDWGQNQPAWVYNPATAFDVIPADDVEAATPTYDTPGTYTITLTVTDSYGATSRDSAQIIVSDSESEPATTDEEL